MCNIYPFKRTGGSTVVISEDAAAVCPSLYMVYNVLERMGKNEVVNF